MLAKKKLYGLLLKCDVFYVVWSIIGLLSPFMLHANDTVATIAGGVVEYIKSPDISMDSEILKISHKKIDVVYDFMNHSDKDVETKVAFPLPPSPVTMGDTYRVFPSWDDFYYAYSLIGETKKDKPNYSFKGPEALPFSDFQRTVNHEKYSYEIVARAIHQSGQDITAVLKKNNIPISSTYLNGFMEPGALFDDPELARKIQKLNLSDKENKVLWQLQLDYVWNQIFPAKKVTHVTHSYKPHVGHHWLTGTKPKFLEDVVFSHRDISPKSLADFFVTDEDRKIILSMFQGKKQKSSDEEHVYRVLELDYILSTGANWKGSIKKFRLEITPPTTTSLVITSLKNLLKKNKQGLYIFEQENFSPKNDLKILFVDPKNFTEIN